MKPLIKKKPAAKPAAKPVTRWPERTMTDPSVVEAYCKKVSDCWRNLKNQGFIEGPKSSRRFVIGELAKVLDGIHDMCGIPKTQHTILNLDESSGLHGQFASGYNIWEMKINVTKMTAGKITKMQFYGLAETLYHEGRHTEQAWLIVVQSFFKHREWSSSQKKYIIPDIFWWTRARSEPDHVANSAKNTAINRDAEPKKDKDGKIYEYYMRLAKKIKEWDESETKYAHITKVIYDHIMCKHISNHWYHKYQTLPRELDAFLIQEKVLEEFKKTSDFKDVAEQAAPHSCAHCHGKNQKHVISGLPLNMVR